MRIGVHVASADPLDAARVRGADIVQMFLSDPQGYKAPPPRADADRLRAADIPIYVHAPYLVNVASGASRIRIPSRRILQDTCDAAAAVGAAAVIVHGGHVDRDTPATDGVANWRKALERLESDVPVLIENTAGGEHAMARSVGDIARLWEGLDGAPTPFGLCLDTCHAHAAGEDLGDIVDRLGAVTPGVDLVHANNSRDPSGSGRDRHARLRDGMIPPDMIADVCARSGVPVVLETPGSAGDHADDVEWLRVTVAARGAG